MERHCMHEFFPIFLIDCSVCLNGGGENKRERAYKIGKRLPQRVVWLQQKLAHFSLCNEPTTLQKLPSVIAGNRRRMKTNGAKCLSIWMAETKAEPAIPLRGFYSANTHRSDEQLDGCRPQWKTALCNFLCSCIAMVYSAFFYLSSLCLNERRGKLIRTEKGAHCFKARGLWMDLTFCRRPIPAAGLTNFYPARTFLQWHRENRGAS